MEPIIIERTWKKTTTVMIELLPGTAFTEENKAHTFRIRGEGPDGEELPLSGSVMGKLIRADGVTIDMDGSVQSGAAELTLVADCYNVPGQFTLTIYLSSSSGSVAIYAAVGNIHRGTTGTELDSGTHVPSLQELTDAYQGALTVLNKAVLYADTQQLTPAQMAQARANIGLTAADDGSGNITFV